MMSLVVAPSALADPKADPEGFWSFFEARSDVPSFPGLESENFASRSVALWRLGNDRSLTVATDYVVDSQTGTLDNALTIEKLYIVQRGYVQYGSSSGFMMARVVEATTRPDAAVTSSYDAAPAASLVIYDLDASSLTPSTTTEVVENAGYDDSGLDYVTKITEWYDDYALVIQAAPVAGSGDNARLMVAEGDASEYRAAFWGEWLEVSDSFIPPAQTLEEIDLPEGWALTVNGDDEIFGLNRTLTFDAEGNIPVSITDLQQETAYAMREVGATAMERLLAPRVTPSALSEWREAIENDQTIVDALASLSADLPGVLSTIAKAMAESGGSPGESMNNTLASFAVAFQQAVSEAAGIIAARLAQMPLPIGATAGGMSVEQVRADILDTLMSANLQMVVDHSGDFARIYVNTGSLPTRSWDLSQLARDGYGFALGGRQSDQLYGSNNDDLLMGADGRDALQGNDGDDLLAGGTGDDLLYGNSGDDILRGGLGADYLEGGSGSDTASYEDAIAGVRVDLSSKNVGGADAVGDVFISIENLTGGGFADTLEGHSGDNILRGMGGNDVLRGRAGADVLDGGDGIDSVSYTDSNGGVRVSLTTGLGTGAHAQGDRLISVENINGSMFRDMLQGDQGDNRLIGFDGDDLLRGEGGADILDGRQGIDVVSYFNSKAGVQVSLTTGTGTGGDAEGDRLLNIENLAGTAFNDRLEGDDGANQLTGYDGNDLLRGLGGADILDGGAGTDSASYFDSTGAVDVDLAAGAGAGGHAEGDQLISIENASGSLFNDVLNGTAAANHLAGQDGNDVLRGRGGADLLDGGLGMDTASYFDAGAGVSVDLATGLGSRGDALGDRLISIESLGGSAFDDVLRGDAAANKLVGFDGADSLDGRGGNDEIHGRGGADVLTGGTGRDRFVYLDASDSTFPGAGRDIITDFSQIEGDRIDLRSIDADTTTAGKQAFVFIGDGGYTGVAGELRLAAVSGGSMLYGDIDGDRRSDFAIMLTGVTGLTPEAFLL
ncbi:calcium-binding protein [Tistrella mobilis]